MTDHEKAIIITYIGICMLQGDKFHIFHEYIESLIGHPIWMHEIPSIADELKKKAEPDFFKLCAENTDNPIIRKIKENEKTDEMKQKIFDLPSIVIELDNHSRKHYVQLSDVLTVIEEFFPSKEE